MARTGFGPCTAGSYCVLGVSHLCPAGRYGSLQNESRLECQGDCEEGYFCPEGSTSPRQQPCGDVTLYCPPASKAPANVSDGYYTIGGRTLENGGRSEADRSMQCSRLFKDPEDSTVPEPQLEFLLRGGNLTLDALRLYGMDAPRRDRACWSSAMGDSETRSGQAQCQPGSYCIQGRRYELPPGRFGAAAGETNPLGQGICSPGYTCGFASTTPTERECGDPTLLCPAGAAVATPVSPGYYSDPHQPPTRRTRQIIAEAGYYAVDAQLYACPKGRFGSGRGRTSESAACRNCEAGWYCPDEAGTDPRAFQCGGSNVYCIEGSSAPLGVPTGHYSTGGFEGVPGWPDNTTRTWYEPAMPGHFVSQGRLFQCPAGRFGNRSLETNPLCEGPCVAGHFCPPGSVNATAFRCGEAYLPAGYEQTETDVLGGLGSGPASADARRLFDAGVAGIRAPGSSATGSVSSTLLGPVGEALAARGLGQRGVPQEASDSVIQWESSVRGKLPRTEFEIPSDASVAERVIVGGPSSIYCTNGSSLPRAVPSGYVSVTKGKADGNNDTRDGISRCPPGFYCHGGIVEPCPPGTHGGGKAGTVKRQCAGLCPAGSYCPLASA